MFISIPMIICVVLILGYYFPQTETDKLIEEMRDPGGLKRKALTDYTAAIKRVKKTIFNDQEGIDSHMSGLGYDTTSRSYAELVALVTPGNKPSATYAGN